MSKLQRLFKRLWKKIFLTKERKVAKPKKWCGTFDHYEEEEIPEYCQFEGCNKKLSMFNMKQCKYCDGYFCINHTAPSEKHNCTGNPDIVPKRMPRSSRGRD